MPSTFEPSERVFRIGLAVVTIGLVAFFLFCIGASPFEAGDIFWQIKTGEYIWTQQTMPHVDPFSFTTTGKNWVEHEWLTELFYYGLHRVGGLLAIRFFFGALWMGAIGSLFLVLRKAIPSGWQRGILIILFLILARRQFIPAPSTISMFFFFIFALLAAPWLVGLSKKRLAFVFIFYWIWCNMHAVALLALGFLALHTCVLAIQLRFDPTERRNARRASFRERMIILVGCTLLSFFTPYGIQIHAYARSGLDFAPFIDEWRPLLGGSYASSLAQTLFGLLSIAFFASRLQAIHNLGWRNWILRFDFFFDLASFFSFILPLFFARFIWLSFFPLLWLFHSNRRSFELFPRLIVFLPLSLAVILFAHLGWNPANGTVIFRPVFYTWNVDSAGLPVGAADYILREKISGNIFSYYIWGGYLIYRLGPDSRLFVDGRAVLHGLKTIQDWSTISDGGPKALALLRAYHANIVVEGLKDPLSQTVLQAGWQLRYADGVSAVIIAPEEGDRRTK